MIACLSYNTYYTAKSILSIIQHHHIQDFAKGDASFNKKLAFLYAKVYAVSAVLNKLLFVENVSWKTFAGRTLSRSAIFEISLKNNHFNSI